MKLQIHLRTKIWCGVNTDINITKIEKQKQEKKVAERNCRK